MSIRRSRREITTDLVCAVLFASVGLCDGDPTSKLLLIAAGYMLGAGLYLRPGLMSWTEEA